MWRVRTRAAVSHQFKVHEMASIASRLSRGGCTEPSNAPPTTRPFAMGSFTAAFTASRRLCCLQRTPACRVLASPAAVA